MHRLSDLGAVCTHVGHGISREGFDAEWRGIDLFTVDGNNVNRCEVFDEADLDAALAAFDQLSPPAPRLENTASQIADRVMARFTARDWNAATEMVADDFSSDDRRRTVNAGLRRGRDAAMKDAHANADLGAKEVTSTVVATRGERLVLRRARYSSSAQRPEAFYVDALSIYEINADGRLAAAVTFDVEDIDAAFAELDARYRAGEAASHAITWSVITTTYAAFNKHERTLPDWVVIDHRPGALFASSDMTASVHAFWDQTPDLRIRIEAVHRLSDFGAVVTHAADGTSPEGFAAEWRMIQVLTVEGDQVRRCELFDEADLAAALSRFDELHPQAPRLENAASRVTQRCRATLAARDWDAMAEILAEGFCSEDRRRVVNSGMRLGRDVGVKDLQAAVDVIGITYLSSVDRDPWGAARTQSVPVSATTRGHQAVQFEVLQVTEIDSDERIVAVVTLDGDDIDAAFKELDARYLAGDAAAYSQTWSVIAESFAAVNRHEVPRTAPGWAMVDHRPIATFEAGDLAAFLDATWDLTTRSASTSRPYIG